MTTANKMTTAPVQAGNTCGISPEFVRTADVQRLLGLKKGTLYNLERLGKVKGVLLRVAGQKSGVRLWHLESIRAYILNQMSQQVAENGANGIAPEVDEVAA